MTDPQQVREEAGEAQRLLQSTLLRDALGELRQEATAAAIGGENTEAREHGRMTVLVIDGLLSRLRGKLDDLTMQERREAKAARQQNPRTIR
jgi:hypothetical protein